MSEETLFRIGGVYLDESGDEIRLVRPSIEAGYAVAELWCGDRWHSYVNPIRLSDGIYDGDLEACGMHLRPGEVANPELLALQTRPQHEPASVEEEPKTDGERFIGLDDAHDALDAALNTAEPKRLPLPGYGQRTPFNNFDGFSVTSDCAYESQPNTCFAGLTLDGCGAFVLPKQAW